jgi:hypothetical protein
LLVAALTGSLGGCAQSRSQADTAWFNDPMPQCRYSGSGRVCNAAAQLATASVSVAPAPPAASAPANTEPSPPNPKWWTLIPGLPNEHLVTVATDFSEAYWISNTMQRSDAGNPVAFIHSESRDLTSGFLSTRITAEVDCKRGKWRLLEVATFPSRNFEGVPRTGQATPNPAWDYVAPGSIGGIEVSYVCNARKPAELRHRHNQKADKPAYL